MPPGNDVAVNYVRTSDGELRTGKTGITVVAGQVLDLPTRALSEAAQLNLNAGASGSGALIDVAQEGVSRQVRLDGQGKASVPALDSGQPVTVTLVATDAEAWRFQPMAPVTRVLQAGTNDQALSLSPRASASISGTVVPPVSGLSLVGATVAVVQEHGNTSATHIGYTDANGHYQVAGLLAGLPTTVAVRHRILRTQDAVPVTLNPGSNTLDLPVVAIDGYFVNPVINFKDANGNVQPEPLEWRTAVHYGAYTHRSDREGRRGRLRRRRRGHRGRRAWRRGLALRRRARGRLQPRLCHRDPARVADERGGPGR